MPAPNILIELREPGRLVLRLALVGIVVYLAVGIEFLAVSSSLLLGALVASRFLASRSLKGLRIRVSKIDARARCGESVSARLQLSNHNKRMPVFFPTFEVLVEGETLPQLSHFDRHIRAGETIELTIAPLLQKRGPQSIAVSSVYSHFPFGLNNARSDAQAVSEEIIVWPKVAHFDVNPIFKQLPSYILQAAGDQTINPEAIDLDRIRNYEHGDPKRSINWKLTARRDKLTVVQARESKVARFELHLDTSSDLWPTEYAFERMLSLLSSLVPELSRRRCLSGITINCDYLPTNNATELMRFFDALSYAQPTAPRFEPEEKPRRRVLWILPDRRQSISVKPLAPDIGALTT